MELTPEQLLLIVPLILVEVALVVWALWDLTRPGRRVRGGSKVLWALVILFVSTFGPIAYLLLGREEAVETDGSAPSAPPAPDAMAGWAAPRDGSTATASPMDASHQATPASVPPAPASAPATPSAMAPAASATAPSSPATAPILPIPTLERVGQAFTGDLAVVCRGLTKRYGGADGVLALDRLDLDVPVGSVFGLLGPNGAGKTTTLRMLVGLSHPTAGSATVAGVEVHADDPELGRHVGFLDQDPRFYGWATGSETVMLVGLLHGMHGSALEARSREVLDQVGLSEAAGRRVATYSGGMRQRLGIAQALVARPPLLILDEPVSSLDPEGRRDLLALIAGLRGTTTVLFSTHVLADVERICDRVGILDHGHLVTEGPLDALLERYALPVYRLDPEDGQEEAVGRLIGRLRPLPWVTAVDTGHGFVRVAVTDPATAGRELLPAVVAEGVGLVAFERARPTLEDVFLQLVGREANSLAVEGDGAGAGR